MVSASSEKEDREDSADTVQEKRRKARPEWRSNQSVSCSASTREGTSAPSSASGSEFSPRADEVEEADELEPLAFGELEPLENPIRVWERRVQSLQPLLRGKRLLQDDLSDLVELKRIDSTGKPPLELVAAGNRPVLVTAPHTIYLLRDGWTPHLAEELTFEVATGLAQELGGACLSWTPAEQRRSSSLWSLAKRRESADPGRLLDPRNRDPNYLSTEELSENPWFRLMLQTAARLESPALHVDVHGCRNPPLTPSHLTVGLGAMWFHAQRKGPAHVASVERFGKVLAAELRPVLEELRLPPAQGVRVVVPQGEAHARFSGAWLPESCRHTQTQQAVQFGGFTHSVQLEMSKALRVALLRHTVTIPRFGNALRAAWAKAKREASR